MPSRGKRRISELRSVEAWLRSGRQLPPALRRRLAAHLVLAGEPAREFVAPLIIGDAEPLVIGRPAAESPAYYPLTVPLRAMPQPRRQFSRLRIIHQRRKPTRLLPWVWWVIGGLGFELRRDLPFVVGAVFCAAAFLSWRIQPHPGVLTQTIESFPGALLGLAWITLPLTLGLAASVLMFPSVMRDWAGILRRRG